MGWGENIGLLDRINDNGRKFVYEPNDPSSHDARDHSTRSSRGFGLYHRPFLAHGCPSTITMSAVKSNRPPNRDEPTP
jgi:hypothetical protein